jgi:hypothetical protein
VALLVGVQWPAGVDDTARWRLQAEVVFLLMIGGALGGLVLRQLRSLRRARSGGRIRGPHRP